MWWVKSRNYNNYYNYGEKRDRYSLQGLPLETVTCMLQEREPVNEARKVKQRFFSFKTIWIHGTYNIEITESAAVFSITIFIIIVYLQSTMPCARNSPK